MQLIDRPFAFIDVENLSQSWSPSFYDFLLMNPSEELNLYVFFDKVAPLDRESVKVRWNQALSGVISKFELVVTLEVAQNLSLEAIVCVSCLSDTLRHPLMLITLYSKNHIMDYVYELKEKLKKFQMAEIHDRIADEMKFFGSSGFPLDLLTERRFQPDDADETGRYFSEMHKINEAEQDALNSLFHHVNIGWYNYNLEDPEESYYSDRWLQMHGFEHGHLPNEQEFISRIHPKDRIHIKSITDYLSHPEAENQKLIEYRVILQDNSIHHISNSLQLIRRENRVVRVIGVANDISEMRSTQLELYKSERLHRLLSETSRDVIFLLEGVPGKTIISYVSDSVKSMMGYEKQELLNVRTISLIHPEDIEPYLEKIWPALNEIGRVLKLSFRIRKKNGEYIWVESLISQFSDGKGQKIRLSVRDITDRKLVENDLQRANDDLLALIKANDNLVFVINRDLIFESVIALDENKLHIPVKDFINKSVADIWADENGHNLIALVNQSFKTGESLHLEYHFTLRGKFNWYKAHSHPFTSHDGTRKVSVVIEIITEQKRAEERLKRSMKMEKELSRMRANFVSMASHQFRTPLTVIKSNMQLLQAANIEHPLVSKVTGRLVNEVNRLVLLMEDILILGKVQADKIQPDFISLCLVDLMDKVIRDINEVQDDGRHVSLEVSGERQRVSGDSNLLQHAIINLLSNAFKYSKGRQAPIVKLDYTPKHNIFLTVQDFGIGIEEGDQKRIFEDFYRAENAKGIQGTGLGLSISREFLALNNCTLEVKSQLNNGSKFIVTFKKTTWKISSELKKS